ncbi:MAG: UDP-N-acetylmuramate dehydrogenase [Clostridia bacterium]|nr:UDP-N-acetylmuramate dehydrogenase [Clostridia bacterium]
MGESSFFSGYEKFTQEKEFDFAKNSTIGCGGKAKIAFFPKTVEEAVELLKRLECDRRPFYVLGNLSNVLPPDGETDTAIVCTKNLNAVRTDGETYAEAGTLSGSFLRACKEAGKTGAEFLLGIPCTLGGALFMNAGAADTYLSTVVKTVFVYERGKTYLVPVEECGYAYKKSIFMENGAVILGAYFHLANATRAEISKKLAFYNARRAHLPKGKSMGCVFKNPFGESAGRLIEGAGVKGLRIGGGIVSPEHANFILNDRHATGKDIKALIALAKNAVWRQYRIRLEEEIRYFT